MKKIVLTFIASCFSLGLLVAQMQMPETAPLDNGDVKKFLRTYEPITEELEELGKKYDEVDMDNYASMKAMAADKEVQSVLTKYGWDEKWMGKLMTITLAYGYVRMQEEMKNMSAEEKKQFDQYMGAYYTQVQESFTDSDLAQVKNNLAELGKLFDDQ